MWLISHHLKYLYRQSPAKPITHLNKHSIKNLVVETENAETIQYETKKSSKHVLMTVEDKISFKCGYR